MQHAEKRYNVWYAKLTVPVDVQHVLGKVRFFQTTQTKSSSEAAPRVAILVALWKAQIAKARGTLPDPKATFWESLRNDLSNAKEQGDEATEMAIFDLAEEAAGKLSDPEEGSRLFKFATDQQGTLLIPLVTAWKDSLRMAQKTIDQQHRDMVKMADHFISLEALTPQKIKVWTDKLMKEGVTASSLTRINNGCRSFWLYLQQSAVKDMIDPDPFVGPFNLAQRVAVRHKVGRSGSSYKPEQLAALYSGAIARKDGPLADLIALGAYTGARIQELCELTADTVKDGVFHIVKSKTEAGIRECPIHPAIIPLVARMLAASEDGYLIPSTSKNQYRNRSHALSLRFGRLKKSMGFGPQHVFHSTRSTLISLMEQAGVVEGIAADIVGHAKKTMTYGLYGNGSVIQQKLKAITTVSYPAPLDSP